MVLHRIESCGSDTRGNRTSTAAQVRTACTNPNEGFMMSYLEVVFLLKVINKVRVSHTGHILQSFKFKISTVTLEKE